MSSKKELEIFLSYLDQIEEKNNKLQQYDTPSKIAADILWTAFMRGDLEGKVADFGTGNGIFAIGAYFLGAKKVYAIEKDEKRIELAKQNSKEMKIDFIHSDISEFDQKIDTVIMNPPFGKKPRHMDRDFLLKAFDLSDNIYSIHTANSYEFLRDFARQRGFNCQKIRELDFPIKRTFDWHKKPVKNFRVVVLLFTKL